MIRTSAIPANSPQLASSAATVPPEATTSPPITGPTMKQTENTAFVIALPSRSRPTGCSTSTVAVRASERATTATIPSHRASASTGTIEKRDVIQASAPNSSASTAYRTGNSRRGAFWSIRTTTNGETSAGKNCELRKKAVEPSALPVCR